MNRLWVRLTLAFALVILVTVAAISVLADLTAGRAFRQYLSYSNTAGFQNLTAQLAAYYETHGSWNGVEETLSQVRILPAPLPRPMTDRRPGTLVWRDEQMRLTLADADALVVYDGPDGRLGRKLSRDERAAAQEILVADQVVGQLVVSRPIQSAILGPLERAFVERLRWLLVIGGLLAGALGILLGLALSRSLTAPLQRLATAARAVARRDFSQRMREREIVADPSPESILPRAPPSARLGQPRPVEDPRHAVDVLRRSDLAAVEQEPEHAGEQQGQEEEHAHHLGLRPLVELVHPPGEPGKHIRAVQGRDREHVQHGQGDVEPSARPQEHRQVAVDRRR